MTTNSTVLDSLASAQGAQEYLFQPDNPYLLVKTPATSTVSNSKAYAQQLRDENENKNAELLEKGMELFRRGQISKAIQV